MICLVILSQSFPKNFCDLHLPKHDDTTVVLVDENEEEYDTKYLVNKNGLSGGWRGFSIAHKLLEVDVLVFQLIQPCKFRVIVDNPFLYAHKLMLLFVVIFGTSLKGSANVPSVIFCHPLIITGIKMTHTSLEFEVLFCKISWIYQFDFLCLLTKISI